MAVVGLPLNRLSIVSPRPDILVENSSVEGIGCCDRCWAIIGDRTRSNTRASVSLLSRIRVDIARIKI